MYLECILLHVNRHLNSVILRALVSEMERSKSMRKLSMFLIPLMVTVGMFTVLGCGGSAGGEESVAYNGVTSPSVIDTTVSTQAAAMMAWNVVEDSQSGEGYADSSILPLATDNSPTLNQILDPDGATQLLYDVLAIPAPGGESAQPLSEMAVPLVYQCIDIPSTAGSVAGYVSGKICGDFVDNEPTSINYIRATFDDFSNDGVVYMAGTMILDMTSSSLELIFRDLNFWDGVEDFYLDGSVSVTDSPPVTTVSYNIFLYDNVLDEGGWLNNLTIVETVYTGYYTVTIDGRVFDYFDGYFEIETIEPLVYDDGAAYPKDGTVKITGADGVSITLDFTGYGVCNISIDVDGDGGDDVGPVSEALT
jgi:hypothetical protein